MAHCTPREVEVLTAAVCEVVHGRPRGFRASAVSALQVACGGLSASEEAFERLAGSLENFGSAPNILNGGNGRG